MSDLYLRSLEGKTDTYLHAALSIHWSSYSNLKKEGKLYLVLLSLYHMLLLYSDLIDSCVNTDFQR